MAASAPARRVVTALVAITAATAVGTPGAHAAHHDHRGVKRLWSQFPLGPQLQTQWAAQAPAPRSPRPPTSAHSRAPAHGVRSGSGDTAWWPWAGIAGAAGVLVAAIAGLKRRRGPRRAAPGTGGAVPPPARAEADPVQPVPSTPPERHPGPSVPPRTLDTLSRAELFAMANDLGYENTILMSREELIRLLSARTPATGTASPRVSDRALLRYAAAYAAACRERDSHPIRAVTALVSPTTDDPIAYSYRMVAEARRRDLLTCPGPGKAGDELTARAKALMEDFAPEGRPSSRR